VREIEQQRTERTAELRLLEGVEAFCTSIREAMEEPSFTVQQKVLQLVVNRIVVEDHQVIIEHVVPTGPVRLQTEQHETKTYDKDEVVRERKRKRTLPRKGLYGQITSGATWQRPDSTGAPTGGHVMTHAAFSAKFPPPKPPNPDRWTREYLTPAEVTQLMQAARTSGATGTVIPR
jgi:hypothetical protein